MQNVKIGLLGFGTVGSGVNSLLEKNGDLIRERAGVNIEIKSICDLRKDEVKGKVKDIYVTSDWKEIINDKDIDIIVELIGGIEPAKSIVAEALKKGKDVVTANKKLLAEEGEFIYAAMDASNASLEFEASVCGGIPCIQTLRDGLVGNRIDTVMGILNGTTNYILTRMQEEGLSFEDALKDAQKKGFAEADPTFDIEGFDAAHKIAVVSRLAFNKKINFKAIPIEGITKISKEDIRYAESIGYIIKLLGMGKISGDKMEISVAPAMIPSHHPLAAVRNEFNAIMFNGDMTGQITMFGKGAGSTPTASAVVSDIVQIVQKKKQIIYHHKIDGNAEMLNPKNLMQRYYMRLSTEDSPGILGKIAGVLGNHNISIASVLQKDQSTKYVPVIIMTHLCCAEDMIQSVREINSFDFVEKDITLIRVEE